MSLEDVAGKLIADLRVRLLDLSNKNKLLNYKHSERARTQVRIVDELPDFLHEKMTNGESISFRSLPEPEGELPDEKEDTFLMALEEARRSDSAWAALAKQDEDITSDRAMNLDRSIRNRVRADLGMSPAKSGKLTSIADWARLNNIAPSFDLPDPAAVGQRESKHTDSEIQTLLLPDDMQGRLAGVLDQAKTTEQEMGVSVLHLAIGFLEWLDAPQAEKPMIAPLLLYPVELDRKPMRAKGQYRYFLRGNAEPVINITLRQRLAQEDLVVPEIEDGDTAETYMAKVAKVIEGKPRWRVRRFATLGLFSFSRLVMYNDLNPSRWSGDAELARAGVMGELFGRREAGDPKIELHDIEDPAVEDEVPLLIRDADSSQHQAIIDVMRGRNLVIKGPPGTGKSQTIANIIAAALVKNKHVLFIAEKAAALDVVKKRLDEAGLGEFCFELHSTKAKKSEVLSSLERRLNVRSRGSSASIESALRELRTLRERLTKHASTINLPFSALEVMDRGAWRKATIHDILWGEQRTRTIGPRVPGLDRVVLPDAMQTTRFDVERRRDRLAAIEQIVAEIIDQFGTVEAHPWRFVTRPEIQFLELAEVVDAAEQVASALDHIDEELRRLSALNVRTPDTLIAIKAFAQTLASIPTPEFNAPDDVLRVLLGGPLREEAVSALASDLEDRGNAIRERDRCLVNGSTTLTSETITALVSKARSLGMAALTMDQLAEKAAQARLELARWSEVIEFAQRLQDVIGIHSALTPRSLRLAVKAADVLAQAERRSLLERQPSVLEEAAQPLLERGYAQIINLRAKDTELRERLVFDASMSVIELRRHAHLLKTTGIIGKLGGEFRAIRKTYRAVLRSPETLIDTKIAELLVELSDHLEARQALEHDPTLRSICQHRFRGLETDIAALLSANRFATVVRTVFAGLGNSEMAVRHFLLRGDIESLDGLRALAADDRFGRLHKLLIEAADLDMDLAEHCKALDRLASEADALRKVFLAAGLRTEATPVQAEAVVPLLARIDELERSLSKSQAGSIFGTAWHGHDTDPALLRAALRSASAIRACVPVGGLCEAIALHPNIAQAVLEFRDLGLNIESIVKSILAQLTAFMARVVDERPTENETARLGSQPIDALSSMLNRAVSARDQLMRWTTLCRGITDARSDGLEPLLDAFDRANAPYLGLADAYDRVLHISLARKAMEQYPELGTTNALSLDNIRQRFQDLDKRIMEMRRLNLIASLSSVPIPQGIQSPKKAECTEATLVRNEIAKKKKHVPLRDLIDRASNAIRAMKPCTMMSPSSVAQFLKPNQRFDLVIIDEASQMRPEEAISALARAKQAIIVGDPQQLPPSNYFDRQDGDGQDDSAEEFEKVVAESILDVARAAFQPARELLWHYRSKHGSLIAFSNRHFYDDRLIVFPSPQEGYADHGVKLISVDGQYGASINVSEAKAVALAAVDFMTQRPDKSLGIVALNQPQRDLILAEVDRLLLRNSAAERYRARWSKTLDPFFVKNLENVQGDERDVIFISTVYGPDKEGNLMQRFGPINGAAGDRRLNVLFSRAKHGVSVFSSMRPDQIRIDAATPRGTRLLRDYLNFAATGQLDTGTHTYQDCDSDFERFVMKSLEAKGYKVVAQVGVAGFRIDLGVRHPDWPYGFLLGIECDGAAYHSSLSARDRDRLRQQILEGLGWTIYRVWSTDWFRDQQHELAKMLAFIDKTLRDCIARRASDSDHLEKLVREQQTELEGDGRPTPATDHPEEVEDGDEEGDPLEASHDGGVPSAETPAPTVYREPPSVPKSRGLAESGSEPHNGTTPRIGIQTPTPKPLERATDTQAIQPAKHRATSAGSVVPPQWQDKFAIACQELLRDGQINALTLDALGTNLGCPLIVRNAVRAANSAAPATREVGGLLSQALLTEMLVALRNRNLDRAKECAEALRSRSEPGCSIAASRWNRP